MSMQNKMFIILLKNTHKKFQKIVTNFIIKIKRYNF